MKAIIKKILKTIIPKSFRMKIRYLDFVANNNKNNNKIKRIFSIARIFFSYHFIIGDKKEPERLIKLYKKITPSNLPKDEFIYFLNDKYLYDLSHSNYSNGTIDYSLVLNYSLNELKNITNDSRLKKEIDAIIEVIKIIYKKNKNNPYADCLCSMINQKTTDFKDALQRIMFINQILWQTNHELMGLGRMDKYLEPYIGDNDEDNRFLDLFFDIMHRDYKFKSSALFGDTGQVIILGGINEDGSYFSNRLTYDILKACMKSNKTDPKIFMRVSKNTPLDLIELCCKSMRLGNGSPLLSNDDVVINSLLNFVYVKEDCYNYICSACWEPFPEGKAIELNNEATLNFLVPFVNAFDDFEDNDSIDIVIQKYKKRLASYLDSIADHLINKVLSDDLIVSVFNKQCLESGKTIKEGGAKYNNMGCTGVGLGNVINSIYAIDYVTNNKKIPITKFIDIVRNNFKGEESLKKDIIDNSSVYCEDSSDVIAVVNDLIDFTSCYFKAKDTRNRKIKFGLSSPQYIMGSKDLCATPDGRENNSPELVHISSNKGLAYSEIINFASKLHYGDRCFNGNVVDLMINPSYIDSDFDKFVLFIKQSIKQGFYQLQTNVVDSKTLIDAKRHPENYKSLIVRVWGFSAYFVELPEEYQDLLIKRALTNESIN